MRDADHSRQAVLTSNHGTVGQLAEQLSGVLGSRGAHLVFCLGLGAASFSSFLANALIGGTLMADGLGQKAEVGSRATKAWTAVVMLIGCGVALLFMLAEKGVTQSLLIAQAATLVAAPVCAVLLYALSSSRRLMGALRNRWPSLVLGAVGLLLMAPLFVRGAKQLLDKLGALFT